MDEEELHQESIYQNVDIKPDLTLDIKVKVEHQEEQDESSGPEYEDEEEKEEESAEWMYNEYETLTTTNWTELTTSADFNNGKKGKRASKTKYLMTCPIVGCTAPPFTQLKAHQRRYHSSYPCPLCFITPFSSDPEYLTHTKTAHAAWNSTSRREYKCELCPPDKPPFTRLAMWRHHIDAHLKKVPRGMRKTPGILKILVLQNVDETTTTRVKQEENEHEQEEPADSWPIMDLPLKLEMVEPQLDDSGHEMFQPDLYGFPDPDFDPQVEPSETLKISSNCLKGSVNCPLCPHPPFQSRIVHREHLFSAHADKWREYQCELCPPEVPPFFNRANWLHHIDAHLKKVPKKLRKTPGILKIYPCALTDPEHSVSGSGYGSLASTSTAPVLPSKRFICSFKKCHIEFEDSLSLKEHEKGHKVPLTYHCPVDGCTRTFRSWGYMFKHMEACERKNLEKGTEEDVEAGVTVKVEPEIEMDLELDLEQSDEEELGIAQTRNRSLKGLRRCPLDGCNQLMRVETLNYHISRCRATTDRRRQRRALLKGENDNSKLAENKFMEKVKCPVKGCSRLLPRGSPFLNHVKKCRRELVKRQRAQGSSAKAEGETEPTKRGRPPNSVIMQDCERSSEMTRVPSDPTTMVTETSDWGPRLEMAPQEDLTSQMGVQTQNQAPETTGGSKEETLSIVSES